MCARFTVGNTSGIPLRFQVVADQLELVPRYNVAPGQFVPVVRTDSGGGRALQLQRFGLIPSWSKDGPPKFATFNARGEDIEQKATYKRPFLRQRCLVPADGFYEWRTEGKLKIPQYFRRQDGDLFAFAAVFDVWREPSSGDPIGSFSLVTTEPNDLIRPIHNRMPVILPREAEDLWLDPECHDVATLKSLLRPFPAEEMISYEVSRAVNRTAAEGPELVEPVAR
jgi:putative SOS response-associated peptidase YedK